jgi:putative membrane protein
MPRQTLRENTGSYARDHLANERTFLAWLRTALAFMGLGVLVAKFLEATELAFAAGLGLIAIGSGMLIYSVIRYERLASFIDRGQYQPARWGPALLGALTLAAALIAVILVLI